MVGRRDAGSFQHFAATFPRPSWDRRKFLSLLNQSPDAAFPKIKRTWSFAVTPRDQLRLRLTDPDFEQLVQAPSPYLTAKPSLGTLRRSLASTRWSARACCTES